MEQKIALGTDGTHVRFAVQTLGRSYQQADGYGRLPSVTPVLAIID
jgi:hypothetical protein